jgi:hypothetical protein
MWLTLAAAGFFTVIAIITLVKAEKSVANGALTVITLLAVGIAVAATTREFGPAGGRSEPPSSQPASAALPALSCIDDLAGEMVVTACEKALFSSPESVAAAVSYAAAQITRVTAFGDAATASGSLTTEQLAVRRAVERDRYGLMAYVLVARDHCTVSECATFRALADRHQILANMDERVYESLITRYAPSWNVPAPVAALSPSPPLVAKPTTADFPSAASTPPVNIMTPEPGTTPPAAARPPASLASAPLPSPRPASSAAPAPAANATPAAAKKQSAPKPAHAPTQLSPSPAPAPAPAASND